MIFAQPDFGGRKLPCLLQGKVYFDFNQSLDFNIKSLVDNFIEDFEEEKFYDCYNKYLENKENLNNKIRTKNKI